MLVDAMPGTGRVVVAHPSARLFAGVLAEREGLDFMLHDFAPTSHVYIFDVDAMLHPTMVAA